MSFDGPRSLLRPSELEPVHVDLRRIILVGIAVWVVVVAVGLGLMAADVVDGRIPAIGAAGVGLGLLGLLWERRNRD